jgi:DNA-binding NtrC family response regulator/pSer/pThr/pTyr-binding forkhead associated (FHA) protein
VLEVVVTCGSERRHFLLTASQCTIGAAPGNDWVLPFEGVSRRHAVAERLAGRLRLRDVGAKNGLVVQGRRVGEVELEPGEEVWLGRARLFLAAASASDAVVSLPDPSSAGSSAAARLASTAALSPGDATSPLHAALDFVRRLAVEGAPSGERLRRRLEELRALIGASAVLLLPLGGRRDPTIQALAGETPSAESLDALARALATGRPPKATDPAATWIHATHHERALAALLEVELAADEWRELTLHATVERFAPVVAGRIHGDDTGSATEAGGLTFPPSLVAGSSPAFQELLATIRRTIEHARTYLILGETGTGKEQIARLIHASQPRLRGPWVAFSAATLPAELVDAEFFGIEKNVATGVAPRPGLFEQANGGTLFLDEIGELPLAAQAKLLRAIQEREVRRVGAVRNSVAVDVRLVAATNCDLEAMVRQGTFREDLYYRLTQVVLRVPPLRERREDLPGLVLAFTERFSREMGKRIPGVRASTLEYLGALAWPGNVRQLEDAVRYAVMGCSRGEPLSRAHFDTNLEAAMRSLQRPRAQQAGRPAGPPGGNTEPLRSATSAAEQLGWSGTDAAAPVSGARPGALPFDGKSPVERGPGETPDYAAIREEHERREVEDALARAGGVLKRAAELLRMTPAGLRARRKRLGLR